MLPAFRGISKERLAVILQDTLADFAKRGHVAVLTDALEVLSDELRQTAFFIAARVALSDGVLREAEKDLLVSLALFLGLSPEQNARLFEGAKAGMSCENGSMSGPAQSAQAAPETPKPPNFCAYIHFADTLQFTPQEILDAVREDFPDLDLPSAPTFMPDMACDTGGTVLSPLVMPGAQADAMMANLISAGPNALNPNVVAMEPRQYRRIPDLEDRLARRRSYISVSVTAGSFSTFDVFRAARLCSCIAATFARLPVALAVYWESADHYLPPLAVDRDGGCGDDRRMAVPAMAQLRDFPISNRRGGDAPSAYQRVCPLCRLRAGPPDCPGRNVGDGDAAGGGRVADHRWRAYFG